MSCDLVRCGGRFGDELSWDFADGGRGGGGGGKCTEKLLGIPVVEFLVRPLFRIS